jgi:signal-transduction protein with cAMP-binding, CBS, and nucleotidyltransferase domain
MLDRHISSLPVVENGKLVGIITTTDLVMAFQCTMQVIQAAAADLLPQKETETTPVA